MPSAALIPGKTPGNRPAWHSGWTDAYWWHDANGDGQLQPEEYQDNPTTLPGQLRYWGEQWLDDLSFVKLQAGTPDAWRIAPSGFDKFGNPVYDGKGWKKRYQLQPFRPGHAELAIRHGAAIVPTGVVGAEESWPQLARLDAVKLFGAPYLPIPATPIPAPVKIHLWYGAPIDVASRFAPADSDRPDVVDALAREVRQRVAELVAEGRAARQGLFR